MTTKQFDRRSIRLRAYDYSSEGMYFVTVCTHDREHLFGNIVNGKMQLNEFGKIVMNCWNELPHHYANVVLDTFVVMPNHFHGIIEIADVGAGLPRPLTQGAETAPLQRWSLGQIVAYFKYQSTKRINIIRNAPGVPVWQRNYFEHVLRHENELAKMRQYVQENPLKWDLDPENLHVNA